MLAAHKGREAVVELLLQKPGLDVNLTGGRYNGTALHIDCGQAHAGIVRRLLAHPSQSCQNAVDGYGNNPLMWAVGMNKVECVRELVAVEGMDLETYDSRGRGLEEVARDEGSLEAWQVVREELGRREDARDKWQKENIDNLVDFIEGNDKKMVTKKKKKTKLPKTGYTQSGRLNKTENCVERKHTRQLATSINNEENNTIYKESVAKDEDGNVDTLVAETIFQANCAAEFLNKDIEDKLQVLKDKNIYVNDISNSKSKEMADLLLGLDTAEDNRSKGLKEINHIDYRIKQMLKRKTC